MLTLALRATGPATGANWHCSRHNWCHPARRHHDHTATTPLRPGLRQGEAVRPKKDTPSIAVFGCDGEKI